MLPETVIIDFFLIFFYQTVTLKILKCKSIFTINSKLFLSCDTDSNNFCVIFLLSIELLLNNVPN